MPDREGPEGQPFSANADLEMLARMVEAMENTSPEMRRSTLEYLLDRYVRQPEREVMRWRCGVCGASCMSTSRCSSSLPANADPSLNRKPEE